VNITLFTTQVTMEWLGIGHMLSNK